MSNDSSTTSGAGALLEAAHLAIRRGWRTIPLYRVGPNGFCTCANGGNCKSAGKHPMHTDWQNAEPMNGVDVQETWDVENPPNLGLATGAASGFWVLDIDPDHGGTDSARRLVEQFGGLPHTRVTVTGSGGWHYHFAMPDFPVTNRRGKLKDYPGIDVRGTGGQIVAPPSVSDKGPYSVRSDVEVLPQAPAWLLDMIRPAPEAEIELPEQQIQAVQQLDAAETARLAKYEAMVIDREIARLRAMAQAAVRPGEQYKGEPWNQTVFDVAATLVQLANAGWTQYPIAQAYQDVFDNAPRDAGFDDATVNKTFESAVHKVGKKARKMPDRPAPSTVYAGDPISDPTAGSGGSSAGPAATTKTRSPHRMRGWDDLGNAQRMIDRYGEVLRWVEEAQTWAVYKDGRWSLDRTQLARAMAQDMLMSLPDTEGNAYESTEQRDAFIKWAKLQRMSARVSACLREAQGRQELQTNLTSFDNHPMLLNVANGVVDLRTGQLLPHAPIIATTDDAGEPVRDLLMQQSPVAYDIGAQAPRWTAFLDRVQPDPAMRHYLQMVLGYSMTGSTAEQAIFVHSGSGANGKSVLLEILSHVAGDYGQVVPRTTLLVSGAAEEHPTAIARQVGKRLLQASETAAGRRLDEETVKGLTGGEKQTARFMNKDFFDFKPTGKIHLVTNHLPRLTDAYSIWRRLHLITWGQTIPESEQDKQLAAKIIAEEASGVLTWLAYGAWLWHQAGSLSKPISAQQDLAAYRSDQDEFGEFINERLLQDDPNARTTLAVLYDAYKSWCFLSGNQKPMRKQDFSRALGERGFEQYRTGEARGFSGLRVRPFVNDPLAVHL